MTAPVDASETGVAVETGGDAVAEQLIRDGITTVFGVPGIQLDYLVDALAKRQSALQFISCRHEQGAAHMADGYARASGTPGVFSVVPGPGVLNAMTGLATAYACSSPVLCLGAQLPTWAIGRGLGLLHEIRNQEEILASVTKTVTRVESVTALAGAVHAGIAEALSGRPRPVAVSLPEDLLQERLAVSPAASPAAPVLQAPDAHAMSEAAVHLQAAERPVIVAGWGVVAAGASEALSRLASTLHAPVVSTANGRGAISDRHPWALSSLGGREVLQEADVVLIVGSRAVRMNGGPLVANSTTKILLNADPDDLGDPHEHAVAILGDARLGLEALAAAVTGTRSVWRAEEMTAVRERCDAQIAGLGELKDWVSALRAGMPDEAVLVGELTQVAYLARVAFPIYEPRTNLTAGYQGSLGYGVPTAIGAKVARPDVPVVSVSGDGGFAYGMSELLTAVLHDVPVVFVVFNDGAYGNVLRTQVERFDGRTLGSRLHNPSFADLGSLFGLDGMRAASPDRLVAMLREAIVNRRPTLIEVPVGEFPDPGAVAREGAHGSGS